MNTHLILLWLQFGITATGGALLLALWWGIQKRFRGQLRAAAGPQSGRKDLGLVLLALASFGWALIAVWSYTGYLGWASGAFHRLGYSILSTLNNLCLVFSIFFMRGAPNWMLRHAKSIRLGTIAVLAASIVLAIALEWQAEQVDGSRNFIAEQVVVSGMKSLPMAIPYDWEPLWIGIPDMVLSVLIIAGLAVAVIRTFTRMDQQAFAALSTLVFFTAILAQIPSGFPNAPFFTEPEVMVGMRVGSKVGTIFVFLVLAASWAMELGSMELPRALRIVFPDRENTILLTIPRKEIFEQALRLRPKQLSLIHI